jgi:predicted secreted protein
MAASSGRDFLVLKNAVAIASLTENGISFDGSPVDITNKDSGGFRELAAFAGAKAIDISASGVLTDTVIRDIALAPAGALLLTDITIEFADGSTIAGDFYLASVDYTGAHDGANTYDMSLQSSGAWTFS